MDIRIRPCAPSGTIACLAALAATVALAATAALAAPPALATTSRRHASARRPARPTHPASAPVSQAPASAPASCPGADSQPTDANLAQVEASTLCLIERLRAAHRLPLLAASAPLQGVAVGQARDMVAGDYFGDQSLSGQTPMQRILASPYPSHAARVNSAQNIGWATGSSATPEGMVQAWMDSPPHREIMLTAHFHDIGVGVTPAAPSSLAQGRAGATYTLELGQRVFTARVSRKASPRRARHH